MIAASILAGRALAPFETAIAIWKSFLAARESYHRLEKNIRSFPHERGTMQLPAPEGNLTLENLVYAPNGQKPIIKGVSLKLDAGETLGIIGPSAAGKSTLAKLMIGILPPTSGTARLDGAEIFKWGRELIGPHVGYMPQQVELFGGTILENIARMEPNPDHAKVVEAAQLAGVHEMILRLPEGYETIVRPGNASLSPGQRQRIGLARAVYGNPRFVVLDEPNASLDGEGEQALLEALSTLRANGVTCVVIAHRPNLVQHTDKILILQNGTLKEYGQTKMVLHKYMAPHAIPAAGGA
ncbi:MAG: ATP-binding cassette domain-containing protein [Alphaproteobacteria bacterium]|nr:ATP-binding cassette domain-containing protein [Alphaproteobacteria bacterium]